MIERGARNIALVARHPASEESRAELEQVRPADAKVEFFGADVAEPAQVQKAMAAIGAVMPPLKGVLHLAATLDGTLLRDSSEEKLRRVMAPKIAGAWNLHVATRDLPLDFFVLFSSSSAVISQPGLASYAAANAFLDALAGFRRAQGLVALSLEFGPWTSIGLARGEGPERGVREYERLGIRTLSPEMALDGLGRAMSSPFANLMILPISWERFGEAQGDDLSSRAFLELTAPTRKNSAAPHPPLLRERLLALGSVRHRRGALEAFLTEQLAQIIKMPASRIDIQKPVGALGMDSLMGLEFVRRLASATSVRLPATAVFNYPTIQLLSAELARRMGMSLEEQPEPELEPVAAMTTDAASVWAVSSMSDEDAVRAILRVKEEVR